MASALAPGGEPPTARSHRPDVLGGRRRVRVGRHTRVRGSARHERPRSGAGPHDRAWPGSTIRPAEDGDAVPTIQQLSLIHISEPTRRTPISYAVFCLKKKKNVKRYQL